MLFKPKLYLSSRTEKPAKCGTCARDRRALQQIALNVHVKHFDLDPLPLLSPIINFHAFLPLIILTIKHIAYIVCVRYVT